MATEEESDSKTVAKISTTQDPNPNGSEKVEQSNIEKAVRFWKHPSLRDVPADQKRSYLHEKGITDDQIHKAWERIAENKVEDAVGHGAHPLSTNLNKNNSPSQPLQLQNAPVPPHHVSPNSYPAPSHPYATQSLSPQYASYDQRQMMYPDEGPLNFVQGSSLVAVGGVLGLTLAAAVRWLNGGEFHLFPPPMLEEGRRLVLQSPNLDEEEEDHEYVEGASHNDGGHDDDGFIDDDDVEKSKLIDHFESLTDLLKSHLNSQGKILQKLSNSSSSITNQSMNLLRSSSSVKEKEASDQNILAVWKQLVEIKAELRSLQLTAGVSNGTQPPWEERVAVAISKLESCIDDINGSMNKTSKSTASVPLIQPSTINKEGTTGSTNVPKEGTTGSKAITSQPQSPPLDTTTTNGVNKTDSEAGETPTLRQSIRKLAVQNDATSLRVGAQLLYLYVVNLSGNLDNPRYRKIFSCNESFQKVENLSGGRDLLRSIGFEESEDSWDWLPSGSAQQEILGLTKLKEAASALNILKSGQQSSANLAESALAVLSPEPDVNFNPKPADATPTASPAT